VKSGQAPHKAWCAQSPNQVAIFMFWCCCLGRVHRHQLHLFRY